MAGDRTRRERRERNIYSWRDAGGHERFVVGYRDSAGKQRWQAVDGGISAARRERDKLMGAKAKGERVAPNPRLKFGEALDRWLAEQVTELRPSTQACYRSYAENHLRPRWGGRRLDALGVSDAAALVRELRAAGLAEWTISGVARVAGRVFVFARRHCDYGGDNPFSLLENSERPKVSATPERRIYTPEELAQTLAASWEPYTTLFRLADVIGGRESELLGLWWENLNLSDPATATVRFTHQVDRKGQRVPLKTEESKALLPLPRSTAAMLLEHRARSTHTGEKAFVFCSRTGRALSQRNVLRALYTAQERARRPDGTPTFPDLFERDARGHLAADEGGAYVLRKANRRDLPPLPDFHALRHTAAMHCEDAEEARDLLRHKNSNVTRTVYRGHFNDKRRESLREKLEARTSSPSEAPSETPAASSGEVLPLRRAQ